MGDDNFRSTPLLLHQDQGCLYQYNSSWTFHAILQISVLLSAKLHFWVIGEWLDMFLNFFKSLSMWRHCLFVAQPSHRYETVSPDEGQDLALDAHCDWFALFVTSNRLSWAHLEPFGYHENFKKLLSHFPIGSRRTKAKSKCLNHYYFIIIFVQQTTYSDLPRSVPPEGVQNPA